ncbi:Uncharacterised protein [Mycobacterium tuberculosis]|nr:Uncharacterised protein [Mycobacterium tuberculosis]
MYARDAPMARSTPISRLRSITEIMNALNRAIAANSATIHWTNTASDPIWATAAFPESTASCPL